MSIKTGCAAIAAAGALLASATAAQAADPGFCNTYATAATRQVGVARSIPRCAMRAVGTRWSQRFEVHFNWCLHAPYSAAVRERDARTAMLRACR
jgi:hypothetical protein